MKIKGNKKKEEIELEKIYRDLSTMGLSPNKLFQGEKEIDIANKKEEVFKRILYKLKSKRPFVVLEAVKSTKEKNGAKKLKKFIYKREVKDVRFFESLEKEVLIHRHILPKVYRNLPKKIRQRVYFPKVIKEKKEKNKIKAFVREKAEGIICGDCYANKKNIWNLENVEMIAYIIKEFQKIKPSTIRKKKIQLPVMDFIDLYQRRSNTDGYSEIIEDLIGGEYLKNIEDLLQKYKKAISKQKIIFLTEDIFCFNIIKMKNNKFGFIDWERPYFGKDISSDYGRFLSRLWVNPRIQKQAIKIVLKINKEIFHFKDLLKTTLLLEYLYCYFHAMKKNKKLKKEKETLKTKRIFKKLFKDILDNKGIWQEKI